MTQYNNYNNQYNSNGELNSSAGKQFAGFLLIILMLAIVGFMIFSIATSRKSKNNEDFLFAPISTETAEGIIPTPPVETSIDTAYQDPSPAEAKETPEPSPIAPEESPEPEAKVTPKTKASPEPKPSPTKEDLGPRFEPPNPDGPPDLNRAVGGLFEGKSGRAVLNIYSKSLPARTYLIDLDNDTYRSLEFKALGNDRYEVEIPPGRYRLKIVKQYFFTFDEAFEVSDGDYAEIDKDPLVKRPYLELKSNPEGARIFINDKYAGNTPQLIQGLDDTTYKVRITKEGKTPVSFEVKLEKGKGVSKTVNLK